MQSTLKNKVHNPLCPVGSVQGLRIGGHKFDRLKRSRREYGLASFYILHFHDNINKISLFRISNSQTYGQAFASTNKVRVKENRPPQTSVDDDISTCDDSMPGDRYCGDL